MNAVSYLSLYHPQYQTLFLGKSSSKKTITTATVINTNNKLSTYYLPHIVIYLILMHYYYDPYFLMKKYRQYGISILTKIPQLVNEKARIIIWAVWLKSAFTDYNTITSPEGINTY